MVVAASEPTRQGAAAVEPTDRPEALDQPAEATPLELETFRPRGAVLITLLYLGLLLVMWGYMYWSLVMGR